MSVPYRQLTTSPAGVAFIKRWEGCELTAYPDPASELAKKCRSQGINPRDYRKLKDWETLPGTPWTIAYGHTGEDVKPGDTITQETAEELLKKDLVRFENAIFNAVRFGLLQHEFDSLVSFAFNVGVTAFKGSSLVNYLNRGMKLHAVDEFSKWVHAKVNGQKVVLPGLVARRNAEKEMFLGKHPQEVVT